MRLFVIMTNLFLEHADKNVCSNILKEGNQFDKLSRRSVLPLHTNKYIHNRMSTLQLIPPEDEYANDILQPLPIERFAQYKSECIKHFPAAIRGHHYLELQERWIRFLNAPENFETSKEISNRCKYTIYAHRNGNAKNCTIFGLTDVATSDDVCIF